mmetsp:Transcript_51814/g.150505  ORF Transcript_51814/g.150505 Transcript_51814/m.150505 type:complete len:298 (+) Transcript_51814:47-940(+)
MSCHPSTKVTSGPAGHLRPRAPGSSAIKVRGPRGRPEAGGALTARAAPASPVLPPEAAGIGTGASEMLLLLTAELKQTCEEAISGGLDKVMLPQQHVADLARIVSEERTASVAEEDSALRPPSEALESFRTLSGTFSSLFKLSADSVAQAPGADGGGRTPGRSHAPCPAKNLASALVLAAACFDAGALQGARLSVVDDEVFAGALGFVLQLSRAQLFGASAAEAAGSRARAVPDLGGLLAEVLRSIHRYLLALRYSPLPSFSRVAFLSARYPWTSLCPDRPPRPRPSRPTAPRCCTP